jgi:hypothetical protein
MALLYSSLVLQLLSLYYFDGVVEIEHPMTADSEVIMFGNNQFTPTAGNIDKNDSSIIDNNSRASRLANSGAVIARSHSQFSAKTIKDQVSTHSSDKLSSSIILLIDDSLFLDYEVKLKKMINYATPLMIIFIPAKKRLHQLSKR